MIPAVNHDVPAEEAGPVLPLQPSTRGQQMTHVQALQFVCTHALSLSLSISLPLSLSLSLTHSLVCVCVFS